MALNLHDTFGETHDMGMVQGTHHSSWVEYNIIDPHTLQITHRFI